MTPETATVVSSGPGPKLTLKDIFDRLQGQADDAQFRLWKFIYDRTWDKKRGVPREGRMTIPKFAAAVQRDASLIRLYIRAHKMRLEDDMSSATEILALARVGRKKWDAVKRVAKEHNVTFSTAVQNYKREIRAEVIRAAGEADLERDFASGTPTLPRKRFQVIYADPPWGNVTSRTGYPVMTIEAICGLPIADQIAAEDCVLFLWVPPCALAEGMRVTAAWGFTFRTHGVWKKDRWGTGQYFRNQHEDLLVATRGDPPRPTSSGRQVSSVIDAPREEHSKKPEVFAKAIERMYPDLSKIELFARKKREGWTAWGNEIVGDPLKPWADLLGRNRVLRKDLESGNPEVWSDDRMVAMERGLSWSLDAIRDTLKSAA